MAPGVPHAVRLWVEQLLRIDPREKPHVYARVFASAEIADLNYWLELLLSAGIATLGLVLNSEAVVIGAMLISPLIGPIIAAGLSLAAADLYLGIRSLLNLAASVLGAVLFSAFLVWLLPFQVPTAQILSRTRPNLLDLGVAILSGLAGSIIVARGGGAGGVTVLPGVAIAVAVMPPLSAVGFGVGAGFQRSIISGASLLFFTNLAAIITAAFLVFFAIRMDAPEVRDYVMRSLYQQRAQGDQLYGLWQRTPLARVLAGMGTLRFRFLMPLALLGILYVPLRKGLVEVRNEAVARGAIQEAIGRMVRPGDIITQQVDLSGERIHVWLVLDQPLPPEKITQARQTIMKKTGRDVELSVRKVASEQELALLRERLRSPAPPPVSRTFEAIRADLLPRLEKPLNEIWPASEIKLLDYELSFDPAGTLVRIKYEAHKPLDATVADMIQRYLQRQLGVENLRLELEKVSPVTSAEKNRGRVKPKSRSR